MYQSWYRSILFSRGTTFNTLLSCGSRAFSYGTYALLSKKLYSRGVERLGCLPFVKIMNRLERPLNNDKGFSKLSKPTKQNRAYHLQFDFP